MNVFGEHVTGTMNVFGKHVDRRFSNVEGRVDAIEKQCMENAARITELSAVKERLDRFDKQMIDMNGKQQELTTQIHTASEPPSTASTAATSTPYELRKIVRLGNLGWNDTSDTILARAKEVLDPAGAQPAEYTGLVSTSRTQGSTAELIFASAARRRS
jgi:DNA-binding FrmR family transcriptional regulator